MYVLGTTVINGANVSIENYILWEMLSICQSLYLYLQYLIITSGLASVAQLDACLTGDQEVAVQLCRVGNILLWRFDHEIFSRVILSLPQIQKGQLSVSGKRMCTILVNRLEDKACPIKVWLGKLTMLDMTPLG